MGLWLGPGLAALEQCWPCLEQWGFRVPGEAFEVRQAGGCHVPVAVPVNVRVKEGYLVDSIYQDSLNTEEQPDCPWLGRQAEGASSPLCPQGDQRQCRGVVPGRVSAQSPTPRCPFWPLLGLWFRPQGTSASAGPAPGAGTGSCGALLGPAPRNGGSILLTSVSSAGSGGMAPDGGAVLSEMGQCDRTTREVRIL